MDDNLSSKQFGQVPDSNRPNRRDRPGNSMRAQNATIEEIRITRDTGYVTISYGVQRDFNAINMEIVTLIVSRNTIIQDRRGRNISVRDLREGMVVDAVFSQAMTRSIPPQSRAYRITVVGDKQARETTVGTVIQVDVRNRFLYTASSTNVMDMMRFVISDETIILNRNGRRINLSNLRTGQRVRVDHANWQTASIPPQTVAYEVRVI